jgi:hypothetical protein
MSFKISTYGILFMGTPHSGGQGARLGELAVNIASIWLNTNSQLLKHLQTNSEWLDQTQMRYLPISGEFNTKFFYEAYATPTVGGNELLVSAPSGVADTTVDRFRWSNSVVDCAETFGVYPRST